MFEPVVFHPQTWLAALQALFALSIGHAVADFPLQGEYLATGKNRRFLLRIQDPSRPVSIWFVCMTVHCLIHAGAVWLITGSSLLGFIEFILHWFIDTIKCEGKTTFNFDQVLHILCKTGYVAAAYLGFLA